MLRHEGGGWSFVLIPPRGHGTQDESGLCSCPAPCSEQDCWFSLSPCECQVVLWAPGKQKSSHQHGATSPSRKELARILLGCSPQGSEHIPKQSQGLPGGAAVNSRWMVLGDSKSRDFRLPDKFCKRREKGCKSQDLDARKEQRWQEIPNQKKTQLALGQMQRRKWRHEQRQRKALFRRAAQEVRSVQGLGFTTLQFWR